MAGETFEGKVVCEVDLCGYTPIIYKISKANVAQTAFEINFEMNAVRLCTKWGTSRHRH